MLEKLLFTLLKSKMQMYHPNMHWKILKSKTALENPFLKIQEDRCEKQDGSVVETYYTVKRDDVVVIVALTKDMDLVMINQYRHPVKQIVLEIPAGYIDSTDTNIEEAAMRELLEETGHKVENPRKIGESFASSGLMNNKVHFFLGFDAIKIQEPNLDENEELEPVLHSWEEALKAINEGRITDLGSLTGILLAKEYLKKLE